MAAGDITRGARAVLANVSRLNSCPVAEARTFGEVQLSGAVGLNLHLIIPINTSAVGGSYDVYIVESQDGTEWTDNIDPTLSTDNVAPKIADAIPVASINTVYNATHRTEAEFHISLNGFEYADNIGIVVDNNSGQIIPASGADGDSVTLKVS